jgi:putative hemolysin
MDRTQRPSTRRSFMRGGLLASLALAASLGALPIPHAAATPKTKKSKSQRVADNISACTDPENGGTATVSDKRGGTTVKCVLPNGQGYTCTHSSQSTRCHSSLTDPVLPTQPLEPISPIANPLEGGEQPLGSDSPFANPGSVPAQPLEPAGGGVTITAYDGGTAGQAKRQGRRRQGHGRGRKR